MDIVKEAKKFAQEEIEKYGMPGPIHFEISEKKAEELAEKLGANRIITLVGVYLMDVKLGEAFQRGRLAEHVQMSVETTREFLEKFDLDKKTKEKIINCVGAHHGQIPFICKEAEIAANADCYRFLSPRGFFALLAGLGQMGLKFEEILNWAEAKLDEKYNILSLDICKQELELYYHQLKKLIKSAREL
jgi:hypothetical protein